MVIHSKSQDRPKEQRSATDPERHIQDPKVQTAEGWKRTLVRDLKKKKSA